MKTVRIFFSPIAESAYKELCERNDKIAQSLLRAIEQKREFLKLNPHYGETLGKKLIPKEYKNVDNLYRVELPDFWRMLYTLSSEESNDETVVLILDILSHPKYNKKFGYKS